MATICFAKCCACGDKNPHGFFLEEPSGLQIGPIHCVKEGKKHISKLAPILDFSATLIRGLESQLVQAGLPAEHPPWPEAEIEKAAAKILRLAPSAREPYIRARIEEGVSSEQDGKKILRKAEELSKKGRGLDT